MDHRRGDDPPLRGAWLAAVLLTLACTSAAPGAGPAAATSSGPAAPSAAAAETPTGEQAPSGTPTPIALRIAYAAASAGQAPAYVAQETGLFREQGLEVELLYLSGTRTDQTIITGDTPIGFGANVITTHLSGADIVAVAGVINQPTFTLYVRPNITGAQDLRGKTLLANQPGAANTLTLQLLLRHFGLDPERDVAIQPAPGIVEQVAMLSQGLADGAIIASPGGLKAVEIGLVPLVNAADLGIPFMQNSVGTTRTYARDHPDTVRRVLRAYVAAVARMRRDAETTKALIGKYTQTDDPLMLDDAYATYRDVWGRPDFRVSPDAVRAVLSVLDVPGADRARPEDFIDNRFIDELHASGFVRQAGAE